MNKSELHQVPVGWNGIMSYDKVECGKYDIPCNGEHKLTAELTEVNEYRATFYLYSETIPVEALNNPLFMLNAFGIILHGEAQRI